MYAQRVHEHAATVLVVVDVTSTTTRQVYVRGPYKAGTGG